jgi:hypothetical protein
MNIIFNKSVFIFLCIIIIIILYYLLQCKNIDTFNLIDAPQDILHNIGNDYYKYNMLNLSPLNINQQFDNYNNQIVDFNDLNMLPLDNNILIKNGMVINTHPSSNNNNMFTSQTYNEPIDNVLDDEPIDDNVLDDEILDDDVLDDEQIDNEPIDDVLDDEILDDEPIDDEPFDDEPKDDDSKDNNTIFDMFV